MPLPRPDRATARVQQAVRSGWRAVRGWPRTYQGALLGLVAILITLGVLAIGSTPSKPSATVGSVTTAVNDVSAHRVSTAVIDEAAHYVSLAYRQTPTGSSTPLVKVFQVPADYMATLEQLLVQADVAVTVQHPVAEATASGQGSVDLPMLLLLSSLGLAAGLYLYRRNRSRSSRPGEGGGNRNGVAAVPETRFSDVAGCDEAIEDLKELVLFLREPGRFLRTGAHAPKGALLCGPPGTGKTLLARAVAGEAGVPMLVAAGSDFSEKYVGVGAQRVRQLFADARKHERAIIFIDEIDATARSRSEGGASANAEHDQTLVALLTEMDGFRSSNVIVLAATNRPDVLDSALTRPGRLDRRIEVPNPDRRGRQRILAVHTADKPVTADVDLLSLARRTPGLSGAQLAALVNEACIEAARRDLQVVDQTCFDNAVATIAIGRARTSALITERDRRITAWHEAGHTLAAYLQPDADDPVQVTIVPRGPAGGVTWMSGNDNVFLTRKAALAQLVTALSGRVAEEVLLEGEFTQGAAGDLESATNLAHQMATRFGMTRLGYRVHEQRAAASSDMVADVVEGLLQDAHAAASTLLAEHRTFLAAVAEALLDEETLTLVQIAELARRTGMARHAVVAVRPPAQGHSSAAPSEPASASRPRESEAPRRFPPTVAAAALLRRVRRQGLPANATGLAPDFF